MNYNGQADKPDLLQSTRRPFKSMDLALSREVNRQGQRNWAIIQTANLVSMSLQCLLTTDFSSVEINS